MHPGGRSIGRAAWAAIVGLAIGAALLAGVDEPERAASATQPPAVPNVLLIETDDQALESLRVMTNVQRTLVASGTTFENSFVGFSLCCPSRATIIGQYAHNHGVMDNRLPAGGAGAVGQGARLRAVDPRAADPAGPRLPAGAPPPAGLERRRRRDHPRPRRRNRHPALGRPLARPAPPRPGRLAGAAT